jgi:hypothetical protein
LCGVLYSSIGLFWVSKEFSETAAFGEVCVSELAASCLCHLRFFRSTAVTKMTTANANTPIPQDTHIKFVPENQLAVELEDSGDESCPFAIKDAT